MQERPLLADDPPPLPAVTSPDDPRLSTAQPLRTQSEAVIRAWARTRDASPATGEPSASGPGTVAVNDGDVGIRFNFPGVGRFREIDWDEWFAHFARYRLVFVFEGGPAGAPLSSRYRMVPEDRLERLERRGD